MSLTLETLPEHHDILIIGAGISGIGAAFYMKRDCPQKSFAILESRHAIGGTWDLFRYPGIRSDSDLYTFGYEFKPWKSESAIADGSQILSYIRETARENDIDRSICFHSKVVAANWNSDTKRWLLTVRHSETGRERTVSAGWVFCASGYCDYDQGYSPKFPGTETFKGQLIHPQFWPENLDYNGKRIVVVGSGATAVTLIPSMTDRAEHITMLQRTPSYVVTLPTVDPAAEKIKKLFDPKLAYRLIRRKNVILSRLMWLFCQKFPKLARKLIISGIRKQLPPDFDVDTHFNPPYNPWDQRLCTVPDGDLFKAISAGKASVVTDSIVRFTEEGIRLKSGRELPADIIVTATGLNLKMLGGMQIHIDGKATNLSEKVAYKGMMLNDVPNFSFAIGYTNSSWTLKVGLLCEHVCKLINYMDEHGYDVCYPVLPEEKFVTRPLLDFGAGYVQRSIANLPRQGPSVPWLTSMNYLSDVKLLREASIEDSCLRFQERTPESRESAQRFRQHPAATA